MRKLFSLVGLFGLVLFSFSIASAAGLPSDYVRPGEKVLVSLEEQINPKHTALIVVDMQNDFVYGPGKLSTPPGKTNRCEEILTPLNAFIDSARKNGVPVVYTFTVHSGDLDLPPFKAPKLRSQTAPVCMEGSKGGEFAAKLNKPLPGERIVTKHGYDAFMDGNLHTLLQNRGIKTLLFAGIDSLVCVDTTLRHGFHLGYYVVFVKDVCASPFPERHEAVMKLYSGPYGCLVPTSTEVSQSWDRVKK